MADGSAAAAVAPPLQVVSWNLTARCHLRCGHCYLDAGARRARDGELDTAACLAVVDEIAALGEGSLLVLTGGEPLLRDDLETIAARAAAQGAMVVVGTSGTLLGAERARRLAEAGVSGVGISLDADAPALHDQLRGLEGAWEGAREGMRAARAAGMQLSVQMSVLPSSLPRLEAVAALAREEGARAFTAYFLVCTGRAEQLADLTPEQYEQACVRLRALEHRHAGEMLVAAKCAPHYRRIVAEREGPDAEVRAFGAGCPAGSAYVRIGPRGEITPCPYLPLELGRVGEQPLARVWAEAPALRALRSRQLGGRCGPCDLRDRCGGCRARAYAARGELLGEDPSCDFEGTLSAARCPAGAGRPSAGPSYGAPPRASMPWTAEASARLGRVPAVLRAMVVGRVERAARRAGEPEVTAERMRAVRRGAPH